jgi:surface antigen
MYRYDDNGDELLIGLVLGGVLGYALNNAQQESSYNYDRYPQTSNAYPVTETYRYSDNSCLQEREYQTTVYVGGKEVDAYGTACLQPDGSWRRGPAQLVSY